MSLSFRLRLVQPLLASRFRISAGQRRGGPARSNASGGVACGGASGFTLLEVLLSIAIILLLGGVLIGGSAHLLSEKPVTPHEVFWKAVQEARKAALKAEHEVRLRYDKDKRRFVIVDGLAPSRLAADGFTREEAALKELPVPVPPGTNPSNSDLEITLLAATKGASILVGGMIVEAQPVPYVTFYSDGTCSAFRVQVVRGGGTSVLSVDPWTCAPVLTPADKNTF